VAIQFNPTPKVRDLLPRISALSSTAGLAVALVVFAFTQYDSLSGPHQTREKGRAISGTNSTSPSVARQSRPVRLTIALVIAGVALLFSVIYVVGFYVPTFATYSGRGSGLIVIFSSISAFVLSFRLSSPAVAGMLVIAGIFMQVPPVQAIIEARTIAVPGPILGVIFFAVVLVLGVVKAVGAFRRV
jgi:hypothetical protein